MKFNLTSAINLVDLAKKLSVGLTKLSIEDNMENFKVIGLSIPSGETVSIRNELTFIPTQYIITSQEGNALITKTKGLDASGNATLEWDDNFLYLINNGSNGVTITVIFMR